MKCQTGDKLYNIITAVESLVVRKEPRLLQEIWKNDGQGSRVHNQQTKH